MRALWLSLVLMWVCLVFAIFLNVAYGSFVGYIPWGCCLIAWMVAAVQEMQR